MFDGKVKEFAGKLVASLLLEGEDWIKRSREAVEPRLIERYATVALTLRTLAKVLESIST